MEISKLLGCRMRIIAGNLKGRIIKAVPGKETRPTSDKIKEAIFHKLGPYFTEGASLDLFAGSGSLGIEAISRGMHRVVFVEKANPAIQTIRQNIHQLSITEQCEVLRMDAFRGLPLLAKRKGKFDLILLDPPYEQISYERVLATIEELDLLSETGKVYVESGPNEAIIFNDTYYTQMYEKRYSSTTSVMILEKVNQ